VATPSKNKTGLKRTFNCAHDRHCYPGSRSDIRSLCGSQSRSLCERLHTHMDVRRGSNQGGALVIPAATRRPLDNNGERHVHTGGSDWCSPSWIGTGGKAIRHNFKRPRGLRHRSLVDTHAHSLCGSHSWIQPICLTIGPTDARARACAHVQVCACAVFLWCSVCVCG
jgi:hypothetical protein